MTKHTEIVRITPKGQMEILSQLEVNQISKESRQSNSYDIYRQCSLAVLDVGNVDDDSRRMMEEFSDFDIRVIVQERGIKLEFENAPASAFVDGELIKGIQEQLFSVLRDIVFIKNQIENNPHFDSESSDGITNAVFHILRNANVLIPRSAPNLVVCWGGHSISRHEYDYTKIVGYELGLRGLDICTGCGPGAMKGPMKGATIGHSKQRHYGGRYIGLTEPGIIAAESPNPIVNDLVILPDIEKRLESFVRCGHGIIVFPGGVGTAEEILYILGILLNPENNEIPFPLIFTGPESSREYFDQIDTFIQLALGRDVREYYQIIVGDAVKVAREINAGLESVKLFRRKKADAFYFNWLLKVESDFQRPFIPTHENVASLHISHELPKHELAAQLRRVFSAIVSGNIKEDGIAAIEAHGPFKIHGDKDIMESLDSLLRAFVEQGRMKIPGQTYVPCYQID